MAHLPEVGFVLLSVGALVTLGGGDPHASEDRAVAARVGRAPSDRASMGGDVGR
jgi:hypothetical protein